MESLPAHVGGNRQDAERGKSPGQSIAVTFANHRTQAFTVASCLAFQQRLISEPVEACGAAIGWIYNKIVSLRN